jgi:hypothetical protein
VIVKDCCGPEHVIPPFVYFGVIVIVAVTGSVPAFTAVNEGIFPVPEAARLIPVLVLVQS